MGLENPVHILMILAVVLLVFGAKRLPEMGRGLGDGMRGFKEAISGQTPAAHAMTAATPTLEPAVATTVVPVTESAPVVAETVA